MAIKMQYLCAPTLSTLSSINFISRRPSVVIVPLFLPVLNAVVTVVVQCFSVSVDTVQSFLTVIVS